MMSSSHCTDGGRGKQQHHQHHAFSPLLEQQMQISLPRHKQCKQYSYSHGVDTRKKRLALQELTAETYHILKVLIKCFHKRVDEFQKSQLILHVCIGKTA